jgi:hypothetical protein
VGRSVGAEPQQVPADPTCDGAKTFRPYSARPSTISPFW